MLTNLKYRDSLKGSLHGISLSYLMLVAIFAVAMASEKSTLSPQEPHVLALDNCDSDYKNPPFNDEILILDSEGKLIKKIGGLSTHAKSASI